MLEELLAAEELEIRVLHEKMDHLVMHQQQELLEIWEPGMSVVELKTRGGRLSALQEVFAAEMEDLGQNYRCFWNKEQINQWRAELSDDN